MAGTDKRKQLLYLPEEMLHEIMREANRLDRSLSWTVQQAWRLAREHVCKFPTGDVQRAAAERASAAPPPVEAQPRVPRERKPDWDRIRAEEQLREFLRGKFDHDVA